MGADLRNRFRGELIAGPLEMADRSHARLDLLEEVAGRVVHRVIDVDRVLPELRIRANLEG